MDMINLHLPDVTASCPLVPPQSGDSHIEIP